MAQLCLLCYAGLFDNVLSDYLWALAILLLGERCSLRRSALWQVSSVTTELVHGIRTGPTIATLGLSLQVPLAVVLDVLFGQPSYLRAVVPALLTGGGAVLVLAGFVGITLHGSAPLAH